MKGLVLLLWNVKGRQSWVAPPNLKSRRQHPPCAQVEDTAGHLYQEDRPAVGMEGAWLCDQRAGGACRNKPSTSCSHCQWHLRPRAQPCPARAAQAELRLAKERGRRKGAVLARQEEEAAARERALEAAAVDARALQHALAQARASAERHQVPLP